MAGISTYQVISSQSAFDHYTAELFPQLLEHARLQTKRFLRETRQWESDVMHEKQAQRWGYELLERFMHWGRGKVPCRPVQLLDSFLFKHYSESKGLCIVADALSPLGHFLDSLLSRAVYSRDAMVASFYHLYGLDQQQVARVLALGSVESQRVYKNYARWRSSGWVRMIQTAGLSELELAQISEQKQHNPVGVHREVAQLVPVLQAHYRKSEPALYPCLSRSQWRDLYEQDYGQDYRGWHLPFCQSCLTEVWSQQGLALKENTQPILNVHIDPMAKAAVAGSCFMEESLLRTT